LAMRSIRNWTVGAVSIALNFTKKLGVGWGHVVAS
jgi:hypothetical protein